MRRNEEHGVLSPSVAMGSGLADPPSIRVLGPVTVGDPRRPIDLGGPRQRAVLALLTANAGKTVTIDQLVDELWGGDLPGGPRRTIQTYVSNLRRLIAPTGARVERQGEGYRLDIDRARLDLTAFEDAVDAAARAPERGEQLTHYRRASALWHGVPFSNIGEVTSLTQLASRLEDRFLDAEELRLGLELERGDPAAAVAGLQALVAAHPWRERFWELLMLGLYRLGRQTEASRVFERARTLLAEVAGLEPSPPLFTMQRRILDHDPTLDTTASSTLAPPPLPAPLRRHLRGTMVGRHDELDELGRLLGRSRQSFTVAVLEGEAGIGKTRLAAEFASRAADAGALVLFGHSDEEYEIAFQPLIETLGLLADHFTAERCVAMGGADAREFARLSPRFGTPRPSDDAELQRYWLSTATATLLQALSSRGPVVWVIDDLQWAGDPMLQLIAHLARTHPDLSMLVIGTLRSGEVAPDQALRRLVVDLHRLGCGHELRLAGLDRESITELVGERWSAAVGAYSGGNPLFVTELALHLDEGGEIGPTAHLAEMVVQRAARLGPTAAAVLRWASIVGGRFRAATLGRLPGLDPMSVLGALDTAHAANLISRIDGDDLIHEFTHALVRDALYQSMPEGERLRSHAVVAETLARQPAPDARTAVEIAHHWTVAAPAGYVAEAITAARTAALMAGRALGRDVAVQLLQRASTLAAAGPGITPRTRAELLIELAEAYYNLGVTADCLDAAELAARIAIDHGHDDLVVAAAVAVTGADAIGDLARGARARALVGAALERTPPQSEAWALLTSKDLILQIFDLRASELAAELTTVLEVLEREAAPDVVRRSVENGCYVVVGEQHRRCVDLLGRAVRPEDPITQMPHLYEMLTGALDEADGPAFRSILAEYRMVARGHRTHEFAANTAHAVTVLWDGHVHEAERTSRTWMANVHEDRPMSTDAGMLAWTMTRAWFADRPAAILPLAERLRAQYRAAMFDAVVAWCEAASGDPSRVIKRAERHDEHHIVVLTAPRLSGWGLWAFVEAAAASADERALRFAGEMLELVSGVDVHGLPHTPQPAVAQLRATIATARGELDLAISEWRQAISVYDRLTDQAFRASASAELATALHRRGRPDDVEEMTGLATAAVSAASRMRLRRPARVALEVLSSLGA